MKNHITRYLGRILVPVPFLFGLIGLTKTPGYSLLDCAYHSVQLYVMEFADGIVMNPCVEIARWTAPCITVAAIITFFYRLVERLRILRLTFRQDPVIIHGDSANIAVMLDQMKHRAMISEDKMGYRVGRQLVMFDRDEDMFEYINSHRKELLSGSSKVILCSENIRRGSYENTQITICNLSENCARLYWEQHPVLREDEKILIIGTGNYGTGILSQAILNNVISTDSAISYHVAGDYRDYFITHPGICRAMEVYTEDEEGREHLYREGLNVCGNRDQIHFHNRSWQEVVSGFGPFDRVIIVTDSDADNLNILNEIKLYFCNDIYHIKYIDRETLKDLWDLDKENITPFGVREELFNEDTIMRDGLFRRAEKIHSRYFSRYLCREREEGRCGKAGTSVCPDCPAFIKDWNSLNVFVRYSNVAQADHVPVKLRLLLGREADINEPGIGERAAAAYKALGKDEQERLREIEHIRWCRYHFFNNWEYASVRDNKKHRHPCLVPFRELAEREKRKDEDAYLALSELL